MALNYLFLIKNNRGLDCKQTCNEILKQYTKKYYPNNKPISKDFIHIDKFINKSTSITISRFKDKLKPIKDQLKPFNFEFNNVFAQINQQFLDYIEQCINYKAQYIVFMIIIITEKSAHINIAIYNSYSQTIEIYEPNTNNDPYKLNSFYFKLIEHIFTLIKKPIPVYIPQSQLSNDVDTFHRLQQLEFCSYDLGHCVSWAIVYASKRLSKPSLSPQQAFQAIHDEINNGQDLSTFINSYGQYMNEKYKFLIDYDLIPKDEQKFLIDELEKNKSIQ
jgi:hypothetical protein